MSNPNDDTIKVLNLRPPGMFSNVNEVVHNIHLASLGRYSFIIEWSRSTYRDDDMPGDPWLYYFEPVYPDLKVEDIRAHHPKLPMTCCTRDNIITPRVEDGSCRTLLLPKDRHYAGGIVNDRIVPNKLVRERIDAFAGAHFHGPIIGLHIRGPGRNDGGALELRNQHFLERGVPLGVYFRAVEKGLVRYPDARIFACSDSSRVIDAIRKRFGARVITYDAVRSAYGEMHAYHVRNRGASYPKYRLGLDVVIEAFCLSMTTLFIHGNSNVANFVLCKAPALENIFVYAESERGPPERGLRKIHRIVNNKIDRLTSRVLRKLLQRHRVPRHKEGLSKRKP